MRAEIHTATSPANIGGAALVTHTLATLDGGRGVVLAEGTGWPRLREPCAAAAVAGFLGAVRDFSTSPAEVLLRAGKAAQRAVVSYCDQLIERELPDAHVLAALLGPTDLHVLDVGSARIYRARGTDVLRLTARDENRPGIRAWEGATSNCDLLPGDILLAGSSMAFSAEGIGRITAHLRADANPPLPLLATMLMEPAVALKLPVAVAILRVR